MMFFLVDSRSTMAARSATETKPPSSRIESTLYGSPLHRGEPQISDLGLRRAGGHLRVVGRDSVDPSGVREFSERTER